MITPSTSYPQSPPSALGGTTSAAQVTAKQGLFSGQVLRGSAVYTLLRWDIGIASWVTVKDPQTARPVKIEPTEGIADGTASKVFDAVPTAYYAAVLTTSQPNADPANLLALDIENNGSAATGPTTVNLAGDATGASNNNTVEKIQHNPVDPELLDGGDAGKVLYWTGTIWRATSVAILSSDLSFGWTFGGSTEEGSIWYISGADTLDRAIANPTDPASVNMYGIFTGAAPDAIMPAGPKERYIRFKTGLTLVPGTRWWLSTDTSGVATNIEPIAPAENGNFAAPGGFIRNITRYAADQVALCSFFPFPVFGPIA